jgi:hypothetical protein
MPLTDAAIKAFKPRLKSGDSVAENGMNAEGDVAAVGRKRTISPHPAPAWSRDLEMETTRRSRQIRPHERRLSWQLNPTKHLANVSLNRL